MSTAKVGSSKKGPVKVRKFNGQVVKPCLFNGRDAGGGKYMAAVDGSGNLVVQNGRPIQYREAELVDA